MNKEKKIKSKKIMVYLFFIVFLIAFIISFIQIIKYINHGKENKKIVEDILSYVVIEKPEEEGIKTNKISVDFQSLKEKNADTVGYLKVNGADIENIVVQSKDNDYYLTHNFEKNENKAGWIFADYRNKLDGTDKNIVIYGHNMRDGSMFSNLKDVLEDEWQNIEENRYITFATESEEALYELFSVYKIEEEDYYITTYFKDDTEFQSFADELKLRSSKEFDCEVTGQDAILTLSTCANNSNYRIVLHAKKITQES